MTAACSALIKTATALLPFLHCSMDVDFASTVYQTPAAELRERADSMEKKDKTIAQFRTDLDACLKSKIKEDAAALTK